MPGPLLSVAIGEAGRRGWQTGPLLIAGHSILELALVTALFLGLAPLLSSSLFFTIVALGGASFLLCMAWGMFRDLPRLSLDSVESKTGGKLLLKGILMSLANPYWSIWWATTGITLMISAKTRGLAGIAFFYVGHITADLLWYTFITLSIARGKQFLKDRYYRILIGLCATFLVGYSIYLIYKGIESL